jgi:hypothetical protein
MITFSELASIQDSIVMAYFKILSHHLPEKIKENYITPQSG